MTSSASAHNDPSLYCAYFGGPRDGFKTGDLPEVFSGKKLTGMTSRLPLAEPHQFSLYAVYVCTSETQVDGFWRFEYRGMTGPNGEQLVPADVPEGHPASAPARYERADEAASVNRFRLVDAELEGFTSDSWGVELVLRALAGSRAPVLPTPNDRVIDHAQYLAYWHGLHYLLVAHLGWRDPGRGLRAWHDAGRPTNDPTLAFIAAVWGRDRTLDAYIAWATLHHDFFTEHARHPHQPSDAWIRWARQVEERHGLELLVGGSNPPHFGSASSSTDPIRDRGQTAVLTIIDEERRRAVYVTGDHGFADDLRQRWSDLPDVAPNNWRVEVFNRRLGYLGEYRRSRTTGRLHVGTHSVHMLGN
ncbi:MAG: hypothetical protein JST33_10390 [Actinobacteria bacterium]|nr:hypothetical protein [Actinomycetota bacterium]